MEEIGTFESHEPKLKKSENQKSDPKSSFEYIPSPSPTDPNPDEKSNPDNEISSKIQNSCQESVSRKSEKSEIESLPIVEVSLNSES